MFHRPAGLAAFCVLGAMLAAAALGPDRSPNPPTTQPAGGRAALEQRFADTLKDAVFVGTWRMTRSDGLEGKALLGASRADRYTIGSAEKLDGDLWIIRARIQFDGRDVELPVPVEVRWAGDTPVITVDQVGIPGVGVYSARVVVFERFYAGTWRGADYGGVMSGQILTSEMAEKLAPFAPEGEAPEEPGESPKDDKPKPASPDKKPG